MRSRVALFLALVLGALLAFRAGFQVWVYGDGPQLIDTFLFRHGLWMHVLYMPTARLLEASGLFGSPLEALRWVSILSGALGVGGVTLLALELGASTPRAFLAGLLAAVTPAVWFFSTTIEVHTLHFAAVAWSALLLSRLSWRPFWPSFAASLLAAPALYLTHKSGLLLAPGCVALALWSARRQAGLVPTRSRIGLFSVGFGVSFGLSVLTARHWDASHNSVGDTVAFISRFNQAWTWDTLREAILLGLGALLPLAGIGARRTKRVDLLPLACFLVPVFVFFLWYAEANKGGYFLSAVPFLALLAERAFPRGRAALLFALPVVGLQAFLGWLHVTEHTHRFSMEERLARCEAVRAAIGSSGTLLSFEPTHQPVTLDLPEMREFNLRSEFLTAVARGMDVETSATQTMDHLRYLTETFPGRMVLDLGLFRRARGNPRLLAYLEAIRRRAEEAYGPVRDGEPRFPMIVVR